MSIRQGQNIIAGTPDASSVKIDNVSITKNTSDGLQTIGVINQNDTTTAVKTWTGTKEQYEAIVTKNANTEYFCTDSRELYLGDVKIGSDSCLEIGDIGFAPLGIDETQNKRRYLNGQVISQAQFVSFTAKVKNAVELTPSLATSETNWQAEVTNSPYGICGKFVIDDTLGTIRLPKYPDWSIREVGQAPVIGNGMTLGLTNGTQNYGLDFVSTNNVAFSAHTTTYGKSVGTAVGTSAPSSSSFGITTDPTKSGMIADLVSANTEDKLQGKWFIQVAKGSEDSVDITREIELNNPFFLGMSRYFESEPKNASWLISNGAFHSGTTYSSFYEWLLKIYNGSETVSGVSVKASTDTYDDFDYVVNTTDTTFRLPIYDGSENLPSSTRINFTGFPYTAPANGFVYIYFSAANSNNRIFVNGNEFLYNQKGSSYFGCSFTVPVCRGDVITYGGTLGGDNRFYPCKGNGSLYFYVGETIQDANIINASGVLAEVANADYVVKSYRSGYNWYRIYKSGWIEQGGRTESGTASPVTVELLKTMSDSKYCLYATANYIISSSGTDTRNVSVGNPTVDSFVYTVVMPSTPSASTVPVYWEVKGQGAK